MFTNKKDVVDRESRSSESTPRESTQRESFSLFSNPEENGFLSERSIRSDSFIQEPSTHRHSGVGDSPLIMEPYFMNMNSLKNDLPNSARRPHLDSLTDDTYDARTSNELSLASLSDDLRMYPAIYGANHGPNPSYPPNNAINNNANRGMIRTPPGLVKATRVPARRGTVNFGSECRPDMSLGICAWAVSDELGRLVDSGTMDFTRCPDHDYLELKALLHGLNAALEHGINVPVIRGCVESVLIYVSGIDVERKNQHSHLRHGPMRNALRIALSKCKGYNVELIPLRENMLCQHMAQQKLHQDDHLTPVFNAGPVPNLGPLPLPLSAHHHMGHQNRAPLQSLSARSHPHPQHPQHSHSTPFPSSITSPALHGSNTHMANAHVPTIHGSSIHGANVQYISHSALPPTSSSSSTSSSNRPAPITIRNLF